MPDDVRVVFGRRAKNALNSDVEIAINIFTMEELRETVRTQLLRNCGFSVATLNLDHVYKLLHDRAFYKAYTECDFITADGFPVAWIGRLTGHRVDRVTGADLVRQMVKLAAQQHQPIAILGSSDISTQRAAEILTFENPGLKTVLRESPKLDPPIHMDQISPMLERLRDSGARICFLAFGAPKQELISAFGRQVCPDIGFFSIGASIDYISGMETRAPRYMQAIALEWLWRLAQNPRRLGIRYLRCLEILPKLVINSVAPHGKDSASE